VKPGAPSCRGPDPSGCERSRNRTYMYLDPLKGSMGLQTTTGCHGHPAALLIHLSRARQVAVPGRTNSGFGLRTRTRAAPSAPPSTCAWSPWLHPARRCTLWRSAWLDPPGSLPTGKCRRNPSATMLTTSGGPLPWCKGFSNSPTCCFAFRDPVLSPLVPLRRRREALRGHLGVDQRILHL